MQVISIFNQKGGVAKSTTASNLSAYLARHGYKVLAIDMDPQSNVTSSFGIDEEDLNGTVYDLLMIDPKELTKGKVFDTIIETKYPRLYCLGSDIGLSNADITMSHLKDRESILKRIISTIETSFDFIIIDCPPNLGLLSVNSLVASNNIIVPMTAEFFSVKGIKDLINTYSLVKKTLNPKLEILGVLITKFKSTTNIAKNIKGSLIEVFGDKVFKTVIREDVKIQYAQEEQIPIIYYYEKCKGYEDYTEFSKEVLAWAKVVQKES